MGSPYRELPKYLLCPRCGEMLSREMEGVSTCMRCEGLWITPGTLDAAFGDPQWPAGQSVWWRNSLDCPACGFEGRQTQMAARMADDVLVDQCAKHGLWLDRGELGRLMGARGDELIALRDLLHVVAPELEKLGARRDQWRADLEMRRGIAAEYRQAQEDEHRRRADAAPDASGRRAQLHELSAQRAQATAEIGRLESELGALREDVQRLDAELTRSRYRAISLERELDATRERLRDLDREAES